MSNSYEILKNEINECFYEIVGLINEIIEHRTETFSGILEVSAEVQEGSEKLFIKSDKIIRSISDSIEDRVKNLNMDQMKRDITDATSTFIEITEELELLSYNTICRTMALGEKGATITHISKEIKKYSESVKNILETVSKNFDDMFEKFKHVSDHLEQNNIAPEGEIADKGAAEEVIISSDVSILIENSQFHDIFMQEMEIINDAVSNINYSSPYEAGLIFGVYEMAVTKLENIKHILNGKLDEIKNILSDFMYTFNTDMQNIMSQTNLLRLEMDKVQEVTDRVCRTVLDMKSSIKDTKSVLDTSRASIGHLAKQSKTFHNLVVITTVEVARINDESLKSVVVSMSKTEDELKTLIEKLDRNMGMWSDLRDDFLSTFYSADKEMKDLSSSSDSEGENTIAEHMRKLEDELAGFRDVFLSDRYVNYFDSNTGKLMSLFDQFNESMQQKFMDFNNMLGDDILSSEDFIKGRNDAEIKDILAPDEDQSSVEFF